MRGAPSWLFVLAMLSACSDPASASWQVVGRHLDAALLSVWGTSADDVYAVGGDTGDGTGPLVVHYDGSTWSRIPTGETGNLWWITGFKNGPVFAGGDGGMILRYENGAFTRMATPGSDTVFGIWGTTPDDVWAVGGAAGGASGAFAWRLQNGAWDVAAGFPSELPGTTAMWKIYGRSANDAWIVGTNGTTVRWDGSSLSRVSAGIGESLFTVHGDADRYVAVGGFGTGLILESSGTMWENVSPAGVPGLVGVYLSATEGYAVGQDGAVVRRTDAGWQQEDLGFNVDETFHSVWIDPDGGVWTAGGQVLTLPLVDGVLMYRGATSVGRIQ